jgi:biopolymer transport protein TolQ
VLILAVSLFAWGVIILKLRSLALGRLANAEFLQVFRHSAHPLSIFQMREEFTFSPLYTVYLRGAEELSFHLLGVDQPDNTFNQRLQGAGRITPSQAQAVRRTLERTTNEVCVKVESLMGAVALASSAAPLLGLLGTVWGIIDCFDQVASAKGAIPVQAITPGVSAALLTTLVGLLVALPSLVAYNFLTSRVRSMTARLENFAGELGTVVDRLYVDHHATTEDIPSISALGPLRTESTASVDGLPDMTQAS